MQFDLDEILKVIDKVKDRGLSYFEYQDTDTKIKIKTPDICQSGAEINPEPASVLAEAEASPESVQYAEVLSPMVGTFYTAPSEGADPFVSVGDTIKKGQIVGIVEAMKLMNEIEADCEGVVSEILVENEQTVEYGQPLMKVKVENA